MENDRGPHTQGHCTLFKRIGTYLKIWVQPFVENGRQGDTVMRRHVLRQEKAEKGGRWLLWTKMTLLMKL